MTGVRLGMVKEVCTTPRDNLNDSSPLRAVEIHGEISCACVKLWVVLNAMYSVFFPTCICTVKFNLQISHR